MARRYSVRIGADKNDLLIFDSDRLRVRLALVRSIDVPVNQNKIDIFGSAEAPGHTAEKKQERADAQLYAFT